MQAPLSRVGQCEQQEVDRPGVYWGAAREGWAWFSGPVVGVALQGEGVYALGLSPSSPLLCSLIKSPRESVESGVPEGYLLMSGVELFLQCLRGPVFLLPTQKALRTEYQWRLFLHPWSQGQTALATLESQGRPPRDTGRCRFSPSGPWSWMPLCEQWRLILDGEGRKRLSGRDGFLKGPGVGGGFQGDCKAGRGSQAAQAPEQFGDCTYGRRGGEG